MKISDIGGEFELIKRLAKKPKNKNIIKGIGDDAAIIKINNKYLALTTDSLVDGSHFSLNYFTPEQVGKKAVEINVSDVFAVGAKPEYALVSLVLPRDIDVELIERIYRGMWQAGEKYNLEIVGGNIAHGKQLVIDVSMIGEAKKEDIKLRSDAKPDDFIFVSGDLGSSTAGLNLFLNNIKDFSEVKKKHLEPEAKFYKVKPFLKYINAMIDVSDGLASEVQRICEQSRTGALIYADKVPVKEITRQAARACNKNALDYALYGGEDFELVYTVSKENLNKVKGHLVGRITKERDIKIYEKGIEKIITKHGYDHFLESNK